MVFQFQLKRMHNLACLSCCLHSQFLLIPPFSQLVHLHFSQFPCILCSPTQATRLYTQAELLTSGRTFRQIFFSWVYQSCWGVLGFSGTSDFLAFCMRSGWSSLNRVGKIWWSLLNYAIHKGTFTHRTFQSSACNYSFSNIERNSQTAAQPIQSIMEFPILASCSQTLRKSFSYSKYVKGKAATRPLESCGCGHRWSFYLTSLSSCQCLESPTGRARNKKQNANMQFLKSHVQHPFLSHFFQRQRVNRCYQ